ncbi:PLC-like phosphodiesterase [Didymella exigua CBS 183.55]|uniref:PLC-like phosphodiesterase n=1 Tax=Didymella exigua CBS 183.55 TaxID=1150837 RepID=A0A6A5RNZ8_9PLEO|nr:PLC-like phosphodiesterase [Didymella exigua CBS 183.55]KAF1930115.1 PLC-like phosphodiesterase [Didymella exigua CBS 183.55]
MVSPTITLLLWTALSPCVSAQLSSILSSLSFTPVPSSLVTEVTPESSSSSFASLSVLRNGSTTTYQSSTTEEVIGITGLAPTASGNATASTSTTARARSTQNTTPCNGHPEYCSRRFSNVSMVVAHNSPFVRPRNAASNQVLEVITQLTDGIRGLQFETQKPNSSSPIRLCHTSCDLLDAGTLESYLATVKGWLDDNPYEVIAIIMGNNNGQDTRNSATDYIHPFQDSGILEYVWTPPARNLNLTEWPTLSEMILRNERVVVMIDYNADQDAVPWLLSEFDYQWETPFSPTDPLFPCTQQRPPNQAEDVSRNRMYMLNHNLNVEIAIAGASILVPAYGLLDQVNADSGNGSLGTNIQGCEEMWGRPPNWLLVDYYNFGNFNGSVFQVAATANGVPYDRDSCCGELRKASGSTALGIDRSWLYAAVSIAVTAVVLL